jgi:hypothetical protein
MLTRWLSELRQAWRAYVASIPVSQEPEPVPDGQIIREAFRSAPVDPAVAKAWGELARMLTSHLPDELAAREELRLKKTLKPGVEAVGALARWMAKVTGPHTKVKGFIVLDWKAREEIEWQAERLFDVHQLQAGWVYNATADTEWKD